MHNLSRLPAKSATLGDMPWSSSFRTPSMSPLMAATWSAVSPRSLRSRLRAGCWWLLPLLLPWSSGRYAEAMRRAIRPVSEDERVVQQRA